MSLLIKVKQLFDVPRLHKRIDELEAELKHAQQNKGPSFREVSKDIDLSGVRQDIIDKIEKDFRPIMERHALDCLKQAFKSDPLKRDVYASVAYDEAAGAIQVRAVMPSHETNFAVYGVFR